MMKWNPEEVMVWVPQPKQKQKLLHPDTAVSRSLR